MNITKMEFRMQHNKYVHDTLNVSFLNDKVIHYLILFIYVLFNKLAIFQ